jgi:hypothetical protein
MELPQGLELERIVRAHFGDEVFPLANQDIDEFIKKSSNGELATDQLLNAVYLSSSGINLRQKDQILDAVLRHLTS